ncbi:hypothetical protein M8R20_00985 [Pseudomonas sp. R2.Fl]|nr:hypothetical protein [Pseudomonas sp. R2.Fl]
MDSYFALSRLEDFIKLGERVLKDYEIQSLRKRLATSQIKTGRFAEAAKVLDPLVRSNPCDMVLMSQRIEALVKGGCYFDFEKELISSIASNPNIATPLIELAELYRQLERFDEACEACLRACIIEPEKFCFVRLLLNISTASPSDVYLDQAISLGERCINSRFDEGIAASLARMYIRCTSIDRALSGLSALSLHVYTKKDRKALFEVVASYYKLERYVECRLLLEKYISSNPSDSEAVYRLVGIIVQQAQPRTAIDVMMRHVREADRDAIFYARVGHILAWSGAANEAMPWLRKALSKDKTLAVAVSDLSLCYELKQEMTTAFLLMKEAVCLMGRDMQNRRVVGLDEMTPARLKRRMMFAAHLVGDSDFARALLVEAQQREPIVLPYPAREWMEGSLAGQKVVALTEAGIGDEIRYTCVYHRLLGEAESVAVTCDPRMESLISRSFPSFKVFAVQREFPRIKVKRQEERKLAMTAKMRNIASDAVIEYGEASDTWIRTVNLFERDSFKKAHVHQSPDHRVLVPDARLAESFAEKLKTQANGRPVIGLSWRGGDRSYSRDPHYFHLEQWDPLLDQQDYCFVNLQYSVADDEIEYLREKLGERFIEFPDLDLRNDMEGLAALCSVLDHVVAICTMVLELSAAVHTPTLYLMRSPQATHAIRLNGYADEFGSYQDDVWAKCRIIPRFGVKDDQLLNRACRYLKKSLSMNREF